LMMAVIKKPLNCLKVLKGVGKRIYLDDLLALHSRLRFSISWP